MKKIITLVLSISIFTNLSFSQYSSIYKDSTTTFLLTVEVFDAAFYGAPLLIEGDTVINGFEYHKSFFDGVYIGGLREDSLYSKAWFRGIQDSDEVLISDLNLVEGDSFNIQSIDFYCEFENDDQDYAIVESVDTLNGRKRINFNCKMGRGFISEKFRFIEGIGPNSSIFYLTNSALDLAYLTCKKYENEELVFHYYPEEDDCLFFTNLKEPFENRIVNFYPNPVSDYIKIDTEELSSVKIVDIRGMVKIEGSAIGSEEMDLSTLETGIYFILITINGRLNAQKLIKI